MSDIQTTRTSEQKRRIAAMSVCFRALQYWCDRAVTEVDRDFALSQLRAAIAGLEGRRN